MAAKDGPDPLDALAATLERTRYELDRYSRELERTPRWRFSRRRALRRRLERRRELLGDRDPRATARS